VFIWAVSHKKQPEGTPAAPGANPDQTARIAELEARILKLESSKSAGSKAGVGA